MTQIRSFLSLFSVSFIVFLERLYLILSYLTPKYSAFYRNLDNYLYLCTRECKYIKIWFSNNSIDLQVLREFCEREREAVSYRKDITFEAKKKAPLSLSSFRLSPSAHDFRALPRAFLCRFPYLCQTKLMIMRSIENRLLLKGRKNCNIFASYIYI